jgi:hypothetical protein
VSGTDTRFRVRIGGHRVRLLFPVMLRESSSALHAGARSDLAPLPLERRLVVPLPVSTAPDAGVHPDAKRARADNGETFV